MSWWRTARRSLLASAGMAVVLSAAAGSVMAVTPCPAGANRHQPYGQVRYAAHAPRLFFPGGFEIGCSTNPYHVNYGGFAVGQAQVFGAPVGYFAGCDAIQSWVMNGSFQWGPMGQAAGGSGAVAQSVMPGNVLLAKFRMVSAYGTADVTMSWAADPACPMW